MQLLVDRALGLIDNIFGNIFDEKTKAILGKVEFNKLSKEIRNSLKNYLNCSDYDNTIITSGTFWNYIENFRIYEAIFLYVYQPQDNSLMETEFLMKLTKDATNYCQTNCAVQRTLVKDFFYTIMNIYKKNLYKKVTDNGQPHMYEILQTKLGFKNVETMMRKMIALQEQSTRTHKQNECSINYITNNYNISKEQVVEIYGEVIKELTVKAKEDFREHAEKLAKEILTPVLAVRPDALMRLSKPKYQIMLADVIKASLYSEKRYDDILIKLMIENLLSDENGETMYIHTKLLTTLKVLPADILRNFATMIPILEYENYNTFKDFKFAINRFEEEAMIGNISINDNTLSILEELSLIQSKNKEHLNNRKAKLRYKMGTVVENFYNHILTSPVICDYYLGIYFYFLASKDNNTRALRGTALDARIDELSKLILSYQEREIDLVKYGQIVDDIIQRDSYLNYDTDVLEIVRKHIQDDSYAYFSRIIFAQLIWYTHFRLFNKNQNINISFVLLIEKFSAYEYTFLGEQLINKISFQSS